MQIYASFMYQNAMICTINAYDMHNKCISYAINMQYIYAKHMHKNAFICHIKYAKHMHQICHKYAKDMLEY
jgi:hypothetical protein